MNAVSDVLILMLVFATLAQAWSWLGAYGGIISLGHGVFFGIGAYAVAVSNLRGGSPWYGALGGALCAVAVAAASGALLLRGKGLIFGVFTLAAGALAESFVAGGHAVGAGNAFAFPHRVGFLNLQFTQAWPYLGLAAAIFAVTQALTYGLRSSRTGYYLRALRSNAGAARSLGIVGRPAQLLVFVASAFMTAVAGSFLTEYRLAVDPHAAFALALSLDIALVGIVAGTMSAWGAPLVGMAYVLLARVFPIHPAGPGGDVALVIEALAIIAIALLRARGRAAFRRPAHAAAATSNA